MANSRTRELHQLVRSMSKAEKRAFRLFAGRSQDDRSKLLYLQLFDLLAEQTQLNEEEIRTGLGNPGSMRFANLKRHLYRQLLISLRLLQKEKKANIKIREYIDFAYVLYDRGLYMQALNMLEKAKKIARRHHTDFSTITIIEIEKLIHSRHITRTKTKPIEELLTQASELADTISHRVKLSNLRMILHKLYVEQGHVRNQEEQKRVEQYFAAEAPDISLRALGAMEQVYLYQSYVWYYYILNDFGQCYSYAARWVALFRDSEELRHRDVDLYLRGFHYLLTAAYNERNHEAFIHHLDELEVFRKSNYNRFNVNTQIISFLYTHSARLNRHFLEGTFSQGLETIKSTRRRIARYHDKLDPHKIMVLYYKIAWMYLGSGKPRRAQDYLEEIMAIRTRSLRDDIQSYTRLMSLMAMLDMEQYLELPRLVRRHGAFFQRVEQKNRVQTTVLQFFREMADTPIMNRRTVMEKYREKLLQLRDEPFERRAFLYLDILPWLEAKIRRCPLAEIIAARRRG